MKNDPVFRDERTTSIENQSYRWGYIFISFGLLLVVMYRGFLYNESNWDLMALVILGGLATTVYQGYHRILTRRWLYLAGIIALASALIAFVIASFLA